MQPDISEALRYLGAPAEPGSSLHRQMTTLSEALTARITPRRTWRVLPLHREEGMLQFASLSLPGRSAERMLRDCRRAVLLVCTLGAEFDVWLRQMQRRDMARAVMLDALGSAYIEAACDEAEKEIASHFPGAYLTDRFSPGYGDLPLMIQPDLLATAEAHRIGVSCIPSMMMTPQKSVSAVIGVAEVPQQARIRGCTFCSMNKSCALRKAGTTCDS